MLRGNAGTDPMSDRMEAARIELLVARRAAQIELEELQAQLAEDRPDATEDRIEGVR